MRPMRSLFTAFAPVLLGLAGVALPLAVAAHTGLDGGSHHGFTQGFMHPLTGADHLLAMLAAGLGVEPMIAASLLVIGLLVATRLHAPGAVALFGTALLSRAV